MKVFVSSTYDDLTEHRSVLERSLALSGIPYNAMEHFGSTTKTPLQTCLNAVSQSDVYVGILGTRYGGAPIGNKLSFTEREYRTALAKKMPMLLYLIDERTATVPARLVAAESDFQRQRLSSLKAVVRRRHTVSFFSTPEHLSVLVLASLIREFGGRF